MNETVPLRLLDVQAGSGSALATVCASTSPQCVTTPPTAPMVLTSLLFAVSPLFNVSWCRTCSERRDSLITSLLVCLYFHTTRQTGSNSLLTLFSSTFLYFLCSVNTSNFTSLNFCVECLSLDSFVKIMHVCDFTCVNL